MNTHKNVIEINGKLYDAKSGTLLGGSVVSPRTTQSIDGFVKTSTKPRISQADSTKSKPISINLQATTRPQMKRTEPAQQRYRKPQRSKTLMRTIVKKPQSTPPPHDIRTFGSNPRKAEQLSRAHSTEKNPFIKKFGDTTFHHRVNKRTEPLYVKEAPSHHHSHEHAKATYPTPPHGRTGHHRSQSEILFDAALDKINPTDKHSHATQKEKKRARKLGSRAIRLGSLAASIILLIGFVAYMNIPNMHMRFASSRAGFAANLPDYQPSGYRLSGPINYKPGQITITFSSNTDDRSYSLTQEVSQWTSQALQENFLNARNKPFEAAQERGRTIFLYDKGSATWVNGGVWYQITSDSLSTDQLVKIASSL